MPAAVGQGADDRRRDARHGHIERDARLFFGRRQVEHARSGARPRAFDGRGRRGDHRRRRGVVAPGLRARVGGRGDRAARAFLGAYRAEDSRADLHRHVQGGDGARCRRTRRGHPQRHLGLAVRGGGARRDGSRRSRMPRARRRHAQPGGHGVPHGHHRRYAGFLP